MNREDSESTPTRRDFLHAAGVAMIAAGGMPAAAQETRTPPASRNALSYQHAPAPLPFDPSRLKGLSERLIRSHWENNYTGAVKALKQIRARLSQSLNDSALPPYLYGAWKKEQLVRTGSVVLHELYFGNTSAISVERVHRPRT